MTRLGDLQESVKRLGFQVDTWSPGDGVTRYRFFNRPSDYFGPANGIYTALGFAEAETFAQGLAQGFEMATKPPLTKPCPTCREPIPEPMEFCDVDCCARHYGFGGMA